MDGRHRKQAPIVPQQKLEALRSLLNRGLLLLLRWILQDLIHSGLEAPHKHKDSTLETHNFHVVRYDLVSRRLLWGWLPSKLRKSFTRSRPWSLNHGFIWDHIKIMALSRTTSRSWLYLGPHEDLTNLVFLRFVDWASISPFRGAESGIDTKCPPSVRSFCGNFFMCRLCFLFIPYYTILPNYHISCYQNS